MAPMVNAFDLLGDDTDNHVKEVIGVVDEREEDAFLALVKKNKEEEKRKMKEEEERKKKEEKKRKEAMIRSSFFGRQGGGPANNKPSARSVSRSVYRSYHSGPRRSTNFVDHGRVNDGYDQRPNYSFDQRQNYRQANGGYGERQNYREVNGGGDQGTQEANNVNNHGVIAPDGEGWQQYHSRRNYIEGGYDDQQQRAPGYERRGRGRGSGRGGYQRWRRSSESETNQPQEQGLELGKETEEGAQAVVESQQDMEQGNNQLQSNGVNENQGGGDGEQPRRPNVNGSIRRKQKKNKMNASSEDQKSQGNNNGDAAPDTSSTLSSTLPTQKKPSFSYTYTLQEYERKLLANKKKPLEAASTNKSDDHETKSLEKEFESMRITEKKKDNNLIFVHQPHLKVKGPQAKANNTINVFPKPRMNYRRRPWWGDNESDDKSEADPSKQAAVAKPIQFTLNIAEFPSLGRA